ncbi:hypothetical protein SDC9_104353 [bioreactor metagenome]|uniref:Uncharacterized protein n=1 Tax=bioreactor metagenome TaxID=1076179 RepID=A0A645AYX9_9ZZZZ
MRALHVDRRGWQEEALEAEGLGPGVGGLDRAGGGEVAVLGQEHHRAVERDVAVPVGDRHHRGVPVGDQVHVGAVDRQRMVDLEGLGVRGGAGPVGDRHLRGELPGRAGLHRAGLEPYGEGVQGQRERRQRAVPEQPAAGEVVVLGDVVGEALAGHHDRGALVAEQGAPGDADQQHQHAQVEQQVAELAQVAPLGGHRAIPADDPEALAAQHRRGRVEHLVGTPGGAGGRRLGQPVQPARGGRGLGPQGPHVDPDPRQDAADQRDEQQQVDRREPRRGVDVEQPERVVDLGQLRVRAAEVQHLGRGDRLLRHDRSRDGRQGEQEEQHQGGPHRRQLGPDPAAGLPAGVRGCFGFRARRRPAVVAAPASVPRASPAGLSSLTPAPSFTALSATPPCPTPLRPTPVTARSRSRRPRSASTPSGVPTARSPAAHRRPPSRSRRSAAPPAGGGGLSRRPPASG